MTVSLLTSNQSTELRSSRFARRSLLPLRHDALWQIKSGMVRTLTVLADGNYSTLGIWGEGDVVGRVFCSTQTYQIECLTPVEVTLISRSRWHELNEAMISHIQRSGELMEILHCGNAEAAVLQLFTWLANRFGQHVSQGKLIDLRLTHQEIAELVGLTRVTVTRILSDLEKQGLIQRQERQFIVTSDRSPFWHYEI
ncbi:Crp/Fnr family transcriptional regulator [Scytonema millei]|uniref:Crp/Fnr family transcriptional regulator n=1 Tax=Scytonema millei VB511283 TaxID=1245923 RepID=A0A9X5EBV1_9CYAN|nr:Crp/Fnr family transcriptional regulator [Scytonema millei]NHC38316.1 Crp/Fnr family transcriptional regulator [Scytonema millei VB511283]